MPVYDYRCHTCSTDFEVTQSFSEDTLEICPANGGPLACAQPGQGKVAKVFSVPGITFKGNGFYRNDSRSSTRTTAGAGSSNGSSSDGDTSGTSDGPAKTDKTDSPAKTGGESKKNEPATAGASGSDSR